ncbi:GNAT family N-acetyltransferase [Paenibacillus sp. SYP-B3998]|uniref:GNAT family N-acetyltransferase n=1 Tax=Paenibacillus sp. SYP-B3998 TaxID=2678564 RepID=A0A6G4A190_9BACL|nr:GNAT family N-acetyltransferase [Paenibacillus sp. SYP-B3998]NEW08256.1 GNAT family N-acetyltransferase [Paenibacillus sp. SYP-B3998]
MITFHTFSELSLKDAVSLWNKGFEHYLIPITLTVDTFVQRTANEGISLDHSIVAFDEKTPIGFVANAFRTYQGQKIAWNGGTGIIPDYRGKGIGRLLIEQAISLYREQAVHVSTLEALSENERAIRLYENMGYQTKDRLLMFQTTDALLSNAFLPRSNHEDYFTLKKASPAELGFLPIYRNDRAWQTQWESLRSGELVLAYNKHSGEVIGYSLYRSIYNEQGELSTIILYQCEVDPSVSNAANIINEMLTEVYAPHRGACKRMTINLSSTNHLVIEALGRAGFTLQLEQVYMVQHV